MRKSGILRVITCMGFIALSVFLTIILPLLLGFNMYDVFAASYEVPGELSVGVGLVFPSTYRETVVTAPTWLMKPEVGDEVIYRSAIKLGESSVLCMGRIRKINNGTYLLENSIPLSTITVSIGNVTPPNLCSPRVDLGNIEGVVIVKSEKQHLLILLTLFIAVTSVTFSTLFSYTFLKHRKI